jgi:endogenous inhibitor of DNA gyrase (YacG/DUF329 family)
MQSQLLADWPQFPFCSPKCRTIDLGRWLSESYTIPKEEVEDADEEEEAESS